MDRINRIKINKSGVNKNFAFAAVLGAFLTVLIAACGLGVDVPAVPAGPVAVTIAVALDGEPAPSGSARTLAPTAELTGLRFELLGVRLDEDGKPAGTGAAEKLAEFDYAKSVSVSLVPVRWLFTLNGYRTDDEGEEALYLSGTLDATPAKGVTLKIFVAPVKEGTGWIDVTVTVPAGSGIAQIEVTSDTEELKATLEVDVDAVEQLMVGSSLKNCNIAPLNMEALGVESVEAGDHIVWLKALDAMGEIVAVRSDLILVRSGVTTAGQIDITADDIDFTKGAPTGLAVIPSSWAPSGTEIQLMWTPYFGATAYQYQRYEGMLTGDEVWTDVSPTAALLTDKGLTPRTTYTYRVKALKTSGAKVLAESQYSEWLDVTTGIAAPEIVSVEPTAVDTLTVTWNEAAGAAKYNVYCGLKTTFASATRVGTVTAGTGATNSFAILGLSDGSGDSSAGDPVSGGGSDGGGSDGDNPIDEPAAAARAASSLDPLATKTSYYVWVTAVDANGLESMPAEAGVEGVILVGFVDSWTWLTTNAKANGAYAIILTGSETPGLVTMASLQRGVKLTLRGVASADGGTTPAVVPSLTWGVSSPQPSFFSVTSGHTLTLENVVLYGRAGANGPVVSVHSGGVFVMRAGAEISGNTNTTTASDSAGGGVNVAGVFNMEDGAITGNAAKGVNNKGGGVYVKAGGTFYYSGNPNPAWPAGVVGGVVTGNTCEKYPDEYPDIYDGNL